MRLHLLLSFCTAASVAFAQPPNDQCSAVTPFDLSIGSTVVRNGTRTAATTTNDGVPTSVLMTTPNVATVWEAFTTTECSNVTVLFCNTPLPATTMWNFLSTTCPADVPIYFSFADFGLLCPNGQFGIQWFNLPPGTYYLPIRCTTSGGDYSMELSAVACIPGPANDECAGAIDLLVNTSCEPTPGSVENGTFSFPATACNGATGVANDDVWFSFVATGTQHTITLNTTSADLDAVMQLFPGDCSSTTPIACADATLDGGTEVMQASGLEVGATYRFRVFHYYTALAYEPEFTICVTGDVGTGMIAPEDPGVRVLPTATQDIVTVQGIRPGSQVRLIDQLGRTLETISVTGEPTVVDLSARRSGVYVVEVLGPDGSGSRISVVRL
ncbi:MAG: T9SS type A sorting domain-containing protein [Flavobacteriales bacterium]|nr:T9SS type A sorting domain-containing protein [Flavobacteriales bacterium]